MKQIRALDQRFRYLVACPGRIGAAVWYHGAFAARLYHDLDYRGAMPGVNGQGPLNSLCREISTQPTPEKIVSEPPHAGNLLPQAR
jgi:hypothetical protein